MSRCWETTSPSNYTYILSLHRHNDDDHSQMSQTWIQGSLIKKLMLPRKDTSQIAVEIKIRFWSLFGVYLCGSVAVCLTVNRSSSLTGSLCKPLYLASRAWISSSQVSLRPKLSLTFLLSVSLSQTHTHTDPSNTQRTHKINTLKKTQFSISDVGAVKQSAGY